MKTICLSVLLVCFVSACLADVYCPPNQRVNCYLNPCQVNRCPVYPTATCTPNYCGGCRAIFYFRGRDVTADCIRAAGGNGYY